MKRIFLLIAVALLTLSTASALDPIKVAIVNTGTAPVSVEIRLNNYSGGTATLLYTQPAANYTPNGSGIIIANISGAGWTAIASNTVTNYHILDVYVGGSLVAQYRLDNLLLSQSQGGVLDIEGNLTPAESGAGSVGSDGNRWSDVYVEESTMHIGPADGELNNTELALSYNTTTNTAHIQVDATDAILATSSGVSIPGTLTATGVTTLGNLTGAGTRNIAVNASGEVVVAESSVNTNTTLTGNGTTGTPLGINLSNNNTWTGQQTFGNVSTTGTLEQQGAVSNSTGDVVINDDANVTGSLDVDTDLNVDGNTIHVGTLDQQGAISNSTGDLLINDTFIANSTGNRIGNNTASLQLDIDGVVGTPALNVDGDLYITGASTLVGATTLGNLTGAGTRNIAVNASGEVVVAESSVNTDATINGNGTTGSPLSLADNAVTSAKINDGAVTTAKINNDAVTTGKIATGAVTTDKIGSSAVTDVKIGSSAVTTVKINDGAVTESKLADDAVATAKIEDKAVTAAKISPGATNGHVLTVSGTDAVWAAPSGSTVSTNATLNGDGSGGSPLGINLANSNTWTGLQTFSNAFSIFQNARIAMTNNDNNARDIRWQEPSGTGSQYIGWRAPSVSQNSNYVFPTAIGTPGQVLALNTVGAFGDSATTHWITPSGGGTVSTNATINGDGSGGSPLGINLANSNTWTVNQTFSSTFLITANARIAMTNSDNNARDIRFQEPSGTGSQYIGWRAPSVTNNGNYVFPATVGSAGQVLSIATTNGVDSATTQWVTPSSGGNLAYTEVTANTTLSTDSQVVFITGSYTVTLPASPATGQLIQIYSESTTATLDPQSKVFRDGGVDYGTSIFSDFTAGTNLSLYYNGTKWLPVARR